MILKTCIVSWVPALRIQNMLTWTKQAADGPAVKALAFSAA